MKNYKWRSELSNAREAKNSPTDKEEVRPQALDQSNKEVKNMSMTLATRLFVFSKIRLFLSLQIVHVRQEGIKFQTPKDLLPNQFHQPNNKFETLATRPQALPQLSNYQKGYYRNIEKGKNTRINQNLNLKSIHKAVEDLVSNHPPPPNIFKGMSPSATFISYLNFD
jgi:hypothetical protein